MVGSTQEILRAQALGADEHLVWWPVLKHDAAVQKRSPTIN
jgi:hypothetical protein